jgi:hypothetical protein
MPHQATNLFRLAAIAILVTMCAGVTLAKAPEEIVHVPAGKPVMVDGKIGPGEWSDAAEAEGPGGARLYIKTSGDFVYVAVQFPAGRSGFTDIYLTSEDGGVYDLHASAKLGERRLDGGKWPEWSNWWNNRGWVANVSRVDSFEKRTFVPAGVREYQIERSRFVGRRVALNAGYVDGISGRKVHGGEVSGIGERVQSRGVAAGSVRPGPLNFCESSVRRN